MRSMFKALACSFCVALTLLAFFSGSVFALTIVALDLEDFEDLVPTDVIGDSDDALRIADGAQGVPGVPFFLDANGVPSDDDDPIMVGDVFDILLGPATANDAVYTPHAGEPSTVPDIDALLITVTFDVSSGLDPLDVYLSEFGGTPVMLDDDTQFGILSDLIAGPPVLGFLSGGGGMSFNPADNDLVGAFLITGTNFNAPVHTDIGDFVFTVPGFNDDYIRTYRIDLFGVDQDYDFRSPQALNEQGEIVASGPNSSGGYLIPEPGSLAIIGSLIVGAALKKPLRLMRK